MGIMVDMMRCEVKCTAGGSMWRRRKVLYYTVASGDHVEEIQFGREEGGASSYDAAAAQ